MPIPTELFDYTLPARLIAQSPADRRDQSRLLVVDRATKAVSHHTFDNISGFLRAGDTLFRNNAAVLPARLRGERPSGGKIECFLLRPAGDEHTWRCLLRPGKRLPVGATFAHPSGAFAGQVVAKEDDGSALVRFATRGEPITAIANRLGDVPLPPYIEREEMAGEPREAQRARDLERYQTVYADPARQVAVAAPTAGLHFTAELLAQLGDQGVRTADITLHVGLGTFKPITTETIEDHAIHRELYEMPPSTQAALFPGGSAGRRVAVGTTSVRAMEDFLATHSAATPHPYLGETGIFIYPPRQFHGVDALITNFHQPRSTLLCLVAAFLSPGSTDGIGWVREIYAEAIAREYRFFSYGDAMLIV